MLLVSNRTLAAPVTLFSSQLNLPHGSWYPCVYKQMLRWLPRLQVATACFSCSPPDLNLLDPYFISMYMHNNHCHWVTAHLQLNILYYVMFCSVMLCMLGYVTLCCVVLCCVVFSFLVLCCLILYYIILYYIILYYIILYIGFPVCKVSLCL